MNICTKCGFNQSVFFGTHAYTCPDAAPAPETKNGEVPAPVDPMFFSFLMGISDRALMSVDTFLTSFAEGKMASGSPDVVSFEDIGKIVGASVSSGITATIQVLTEQNLINEENWDEYFSEVPDPEDF